MQPQCHGCFNYDHVMTHYDNYEVTFFFIIRGTWMYLGESAMSGPLGPHGTPFFWEVEHPKLCHASGLPVQGHAAELFGNPCCGKNDPTSVARCEMVKVHIRRAVSVVIIRL